MDYRFRIEPPKSLTASGRCHSMTSFYQLTELRKRQTRESETAGHFYALVSKTLTGTPQETSTS